MAVKKITQAGHPALKAENKEVKDFSSHKLKKLIKDLKDTMYDSGLIGIASPQIGVNEMVFVTHPRNTKSRNIGKEDICRVFINPQIIGQLKENIIIYEGCGSVAEMKLFGPVLRPKKITVEALDEKGKKFLITCDGLLARVIQHEVDHLMGMEFIQKVSDYNKVLSDDFYHKTIRNSKAQKDASKIAKIEVKHL